jgi:hypothetical protein
LVYEVGAFVEKDHLQRMSIHYPTGDDKSSPPLREYGASYGVNPPPDFQPAVAELFNRCEPVEAVRLLTAAVEKQLAAQRKPKTPYAMALMRGLLAREELKQAEGGSYSAEETRALLGISKAAVLKRFQKHQLVGWREAGQGAVRFPAWQFLNNNVLPGLPEVLAVFSKEDWVDDWKIVLFFLTPRLSLDGRRPLDLLREGETRRVSQLAEASLE